MLKLPFRVTLLIWLVLTLTAWNILKLWTLLSWRPTLAEFSIQPAPAISSLSSIVWSFLGGLILFGIWQSKTWTGRLLIFTAAGYSAWYWVDRLAWQGPRPNWPFAVLLNLALMLLVISTIKPLERESYDRKSVH
jgi:hypothetical protein